MLGRPHYSAADTAWAWRLCTVEYTTQRKQSSVRGKKKQLMLRGGGKDCRSRSGTEAEAMTVEAVSA